MMNPPPRPELYLHQEDVLLLGCGHELFHLPGVHGEGLLAQHVLPGLKEQQADPPVLGVQHAHVHDVCQGSRSRGPTGDPALTQT